MTRGRLDARIALVTGSGGPMGLAIARRFAAEGARLVMTDISGNRLDAGLDAVRESAGSADHAVGLRADVTQADECERLVALALDTFGRIDILINVVGGWRGGSADSATTPAWAIDDTRWDQTFDLNLKPGLNLLRRLVPGMLEREYGKVVNLSSVNFAGEAGAADYGAAKAAVASLTRTLALELAPHVNVNCIAPGIIKTRVVAMLGPELAERYRQRSLLKRLGEPEDIANAALFLASDEASYITGQILAVSGGLWPAL